MVRALKSLRAIRLVRTFRRGSAFTLPVIDALGSRNRLALLSDGLRFFRGLRMLVKACYCFLPSLAWSMVLLLVFMWMATLVLGNLLQDFILAAWRADAWGAFATMGARTVSKDGLKLRVLLARMG